MVVVVMVRWMVYILVDAVRPGIKHVVRVMGCIAAARMKRLINIYILNNFRKVRRII